MQFFKRPLIGEISCLSYQNSKMHEHMLLLTGIHKELIMTSCQLTTTYQFFVPKKFDDSPHQFYQNPLIKKAAESDIKGMKI